MRELAGELLRGQEAWVVGGAVRDELLGRRVVDLDIACREPREAARAYARRSGGSAFPLSERHGAWRVALEEERTVDFTPLRGKIEADLATRDFTLNAIAVPLAGGDPVDPFGGRTDLERRIIRAVGATIFTDDPLRLLRAVRLEDELRFRLDPATEHGVRAHAELVTRPAGERTLAELERLSARGFRRLDELGLLGPLGGSVDCLDSLPEEPSDLLLAAVLGASLQRLPVSNALARFARMLLRAEPPAGDSPRQIHRFRRATEPWALEALSYLGLPELREQILKARASQPAEPLLRGDELGLPPGPAIGVVLARIEEERAAGTISTREEALELARRVRGS